MDKEVWFRIGVVTVGMLPIVLVVFVLFSK